MKPFRKAPKDEPPCDERERQRQRHTETEKDRQGQREREGRRWGVRGRGAKEHQGSRHE